MRFQSIQCQSESTQSRTLNTLPSKQSSDLMQTKQSGDLETINQVTFNPDQ